MLRIFFKKTYLAYTLIILNAIPAQAKLDVPFLGEIRWVTFNFAPKGWVPCDGRNLRIADNNQLFVLIKNLYGGDGITTFAIPDLRGRTPIGYGQGPTLSQRDAGSKGGSEKQTITIEQLPAHSHDVLGTNEVGNTDIPTGNLLASGSLGYKDTTAKLPLSTATISEAGMSQPHDNMTPFVTLYCIFAVEGNAVFPNIP